VTDHGSRLSTAYADAAQSSGTTWNASAPRARTETFCAVEKSADRRGKVDPGKQAHLLDDFCRQTRRQLSSENPAYLTQYFYQSFRMRDDGRYLFSLRWTGWDERCPAEESIELETCIDAMEQNFKKCKLTILKPTYQGS